jgi:ferredoxin
VQEELCSKNSVVLKINGLKNFLIVKKRRSAMKVYVDPELCSGCGPCVDTCPEAFELNEEGIAVVKVDEVAAEIQEACKEAADSCPTEAISIEE